MKIKCLTIFLGLFVATLGAFAQPKVVAHRGYWKCEGSAQNSIRSLIEADRIKTYGAELDVYLTADNVVVLNHDRTAGAQKLVVEKSTYDQLRTIQLSNGETLPTLVEYLEQAKVSKHPRLVIELKPHTTADREKELAVAVVQLVKRYKMTKRVDYISFSRVLVEEIVKLSPRAKVYYLNGDLSPEELKTIGMTGLDYSLNTMRKNENWFYQAHKLGLKVNVWTVNNADDMQYVIDKRADFITTDEPELLQSLIRNN